jgi:hypothetical protein
MRRPNSRAASSRYALSADMAPTLPVKRLAQRPKPFGVGASVQSSLPPPGVSHIASATSTTAEEGDLKELFSDMDSDDEDDGNLTDLFEAISDDE